MSLSMSCRWERSVLLLSLQETWSWWCPRRWTCSMIEDGDSNENEDRRFSRVYPCCEKKSSRRRSSKTIACKSGERKGGIENSTSMQDSIETNCRRNCRRDCKTNYRRNCRRDCKRTKREEELESWVSFLLRWRYSQGIMAWKLALTQLHSFYCLSSSRQKESSFFSLVSVWTLFFRLYFFFPSFLWHTTCLFFLSLVCFSDTSVIQRLQSPLPSMSPLNESRRNAVCVCLSRDKSMWGWFLRGKLSSLLWQVGVSFIPLFGVVRKTDNIVRI